MATKPARGGKARAQKPRSEPRHEEHARDELDDMTVQDLNALIHRATAIRDSKITTARKEFIDRTRAEAAELGLSMDDVAPRARSSRKERAGSGERRAAAVKYRGSTGETWTGRGRTPKWLAALEAEGHKREEYLVDKE